MALGEELRVVFSFDFLWVVMTGAAFSPEPEERSSWAVKKVKLIHSSTAKTNTSSTTLKRKRSKRRGRKRQRRSRKRGQEKVWKKGRCSIGGKEDMEREEENKERR